MACKYFIDGKQLSEQELKSYVSDKYIDSKDIKFTTLDDIANILAYSNSKIILDGWKVEYSTPLGNKYDTLEEVNNEIRGLADANVEVDLSDIKENVKPFESINHFTVSNYNFYKENGKWYEDSMGFPMSFEEDYVRKQYEKTSLKGFIEKNKEYEQSKEIIEQWKKENNIQYDPEEVYSRGQGFYSSIGAYSNLELDLLLKNLIQHIQDNKKASQPNVILPIGTSGSGKSTFIKSLPQENLVIIEPDAMRVEFTGDMNNKSKDKEIYIEAAQRAIKAIKQGKQVVFDTTNLTKDKRLPFIEAIKKEIPNANIQYKLMELNPELAKQRIKADIAAGKNRANVPDSTIDRHAESYKQMLEDIKNEPITPYGSNYGFTISAFTKPIDKRLKHIEGTGDRVRFVIYPKSEHIKWAAPTDVYSGSVWDAHEKVSKDKKSELLGVSFTKAPALKSIHEVSPNLADIIDNLSHLHNELGIELTTSNFEIEYDDSVPYETKQIINAVNKLLEQKRGGKLEKPEIKKEVIKNEDVYELRWKNGNVIGRYNFLEAAKKAQVGEYTDSNGNKISAEEATEIVKGQPIEKIGKQPTQTKENTTSIESVKDNIIGFSKKDQTQLDYLIRLDERNEITTDQEIELKELKNKKKNTPQKEYTSQAETNLKIAALKEVARKYPRSLITSKVVPINPNMVDNSEIQYSKTNNNTEQQTPEDLLTKMIDSGAIQKDCTGGFKAKDGIRGKFTKGSQREIYEIFEGKSHKQGGIGINIKNNGL